MYKRLILENNKKEISHETIGGNKSLANEDGTQQSGPSQGQPKQVSRRKFLINTGYVLGGVVLGGAAGALIKKNPPTAAPPPSAPAAEPRNYNRALMFFNQGQFAIVDAAAERIFPADENGPGAKALGAAFYIDHELAGAWGLNAKEYMDPPFFVGEKTQGYQGRLRRREMFEIAIQEMENYSISKYSKSFTELTGEQQDVVLKAFETDEVKLTTISPSGFFKILRSSTIEGTYCDPLYGGNLNMDGWRMRNFPGNQMSYTNVIDKGFTIIPPKSLQDHLSL
jgi:gluconate 2-dehydrogenase gamma chain